MSPPAVAKCSREGAQEVKTGFSAPEPVLNNCNIYFVHQGGAIFCQSNVPFQGPECKIENNKIFCNEDRLTLVHLPESCAKHFDSKNIVQNPKKSSKKKCAEPAKSETESSDAECFDDESDEEVSLPRLIPPKPVELPDYFQKKMHNICTHCDCKGDILYRIFQKPEPHFDACFRYFDGKKKLTKPNGRCFLKFYSLRLPFLSKQGLTLSVVQHIRAEGNKFVPAYDGSGDNREQIFAFITGLTTEDLHDLLTDLFARWQDFAHEHLKSSAGMTTMLFLAATLFQYGNIVKDSILIAFYKLRKCDCQLRRAIQKLKRRNQSQKRKHKDTYEDTRDVTTEIEGVNETLINMNIDLTGTRSTMNFLAESANLLVNRVSFFEVSVMGCLQGYPGGLHLRNEFKKLDIHKELTRDKDKLEIVRKTMEQYKVDIQALQQHIDINVGMLRNVIAEREKTIQLGILANTDRDGSKMKIISFLTVLLLPATFMAIFFTTPMFDWDSSTSSNTVTVKQPWTLYWKVTGPSTAALLVIGLFLSNPEWFILLIDILGLKQLFAWIGIYGFMTSRRKNLKYRHLAKEEARHISPSATMKLHGKEATVNGKATSKGKETSGLIRRVRSIFWKKENHNGAPHLPNDVEARGK